MSQTGIDGRHKIGINHALLINNTSSDDYQVTVGIGYNSNVNADGSNSFADVDLRIEDWTSGSPVELIFSDILSDSINGDEDADEDTGTAGDAQADAGVRTFTVDIAGNSSLDLREKLNMESENYESDGLATAAIQSPSIDRAVVDIESMLLHNLLAHTIG